MISKNKYIAEQFQKIKRIRRRNKEELGGIGMGGVAEKKIYFWSKLATKPEKEEKDILSFNEVEEDKSIREVIRSLENKIIGNKRDFRDIKPNNPSIKKWIEHVINLYPDRDDDIVEDIINEFRSVLYTKSKEKEKFIIGVLQLNDVFVIVHCRKDPSLAELKDKLYSVKTILHPKNIIRADIIKNEDGKLTLSAFEYSRKFSVGHAKFWGIEPEDIGWESLGSITLNVEMETFSLPFQIPIEAEQLKEMMDQKYISPTGKIKIGRENGKITKVFIYGKAMEYSQFYDFFITETEKLKNHKNKFNEIITPTPPISVFDGTIRYEEDRNNVYEITAEGTKSIHKKEHPRFTICFFTQHYPGIKLKENFLWEIYQSIFDNKYLEVWHAGEQSSSEPTRIGSLMVYNKINLPDDLMIFSDNLLNLIQDARSRKAKLLLQSCFCRLYSENMKNKHFKVVFDFLNDSIISKEIEFEFNQNR